MKLQLIYTITPQILLSIHMYIHTYIFICICRCISCDTISCTAAIPLTTSSVLLMHACMCLHIHARLCIYPFSHCCVCVCVCTFFPSLRAWEYNWNCCINNKRKYHEKKINFILSIMQTSLQRIEMRGRATKEKTEKKEGEREKCRHFTFSSLKC